MRCCGITHVTRHLLSLLDDVFLWWAVLGPDHLH